MVIVTQLEACCNKTAFVRIFINCKLLIQTLETENENNLIEKGVLPYNQYIHSKRMGLCAMYCVYQNNQQNCYTNTV